MDFRNIPINPINQIFSRPNHTSINIVNIKQKETNVALKIIGLKFKEHLHELALKELKEAEQKTFNIAITELLNLKFKEKIALKGGFSDLFFEELYARRKANKQYITLKNLQRVIYQTEETINNGSPRSTIYWERILFVLNQVFFYMVKHKTKIINFSLISVLLFLLIKNHRIVKLILLNIFSKIKLKKFKGPLQKECTFPELDGVEETLLMDNSTDICPEGSDPFEHY